MTIRHELIKYANDCINDKIPSCIKHKWACMRFLRDVERAEKEDCFFFWDETEAKRIAFSIFGDQRNFSRSIHILDNSSEIWIMPDLWLETQIKRVKEIQ